MWTTDYLRVIHRPDELANVPLVIDGDRKPLRLAQDTKAYSQMLEAEKPAQSNAVRKHSRHRLAPESSSTEDEDEESDSLPIRGRNTPVSGASTVTERPTAPLPARAKVVTSNPRPAKRQRTDEEEDTSREQQHNGSSHAGSSRGTVATGATGHAPNPTLC